MRSITGDIRRATEDLDLDFIRYSLDDDSIRDFIIKLNCLDGIAIDIKNDKIEPLSQQEYSGKRVYITIKDNFGNSLESKIDLGVHANIKIEQDDYCFDVCMDDEGASLLIIEEPSMREHDIEEIRKRVATTFTNRQFRKNVEHSSDRNWLQIDVGEAFQMIQTFLDSIDL